MFPDFDGADASVAAQTKFGVLGGGDAQHVGDNGAEGAAVADDGNGFAVLVNGR